MNIQPVVIDEDEFRKYLGQVYAYDIPSAVQDLIYKSGKQAVPKNDWDELEEYYSQWARKIGRGLGEFWEMKKLKEIA